MPRRLIHWKGILVTLYHVLRFQSPLATQEEIILDFLFLTCLPCQVWRVNRALSADVMLILFYWEKVLQSSPAVASSKIFWIARLWRRGSNARFVVREALRILNVGRPVLC